VNCARARRKFPDSWTGLADADLMAHLAGCRACAEELRVFRAVLELAAGHAAVPDPGDAYWRRFLPIVRARLMEVPATRLPRRVSVRAAVAALLMAGAAAGALLLPSPPVGLDSPAGEAGVRMERMLRQRPEFAPAVAADVAGVDPVLAWDTAHLLELIDEADQTADLAGEWAEDGLWSIIDRLSHEQAIRLKAELSAEKG